MIAISKKHTGPSFPRAKIEAAVKTALPKGKSFEIHVAESGIRRLKIVRVVTPAWKTLWAGDRIRKVLKVMDAALSPLEHGRILRFSVLTPKEYRDVVLNSPVGRARKLIKNGGAKKLAAKRKAAPKSKRVLAK